MEIAEAVRLIGNLAYRSCNDTDMEAWQTLRAIVLAQQRPTPAIAPCALCLHVQMLYQDSSLRCGVHADV